MNQDRRLPKIQAALSVVLKRGYLLVVTFVAHVFAPDVDSLEFIAVTPKFMPMLLTGIM